MKRLFLFAICLILAQGLALAAMLPATSTLDLTFLSYSGTSSAITVDLGSGPVSTGLISYNLDTSFGMDNFWQINFDTGATDTRLHLLITAPLLTTLGLPAIPLEINEVGPLDFIPLVDTSGAPFTLQISATTVGGGTIQTGLFSGFVFSNDNTNNSNNNANGNSTNIGHGTGNHVSVGNTSSSNTGTITPPGGASQFTFGTGTGTTAQVPEPSSIWLSSTGLAFVYWQIRKKRRLNIRGA